MFRFINRIVVLENARCSTSPPVELRILFYCRYNQGCKHILSAIWQPPVSKTPPSWRLSPCRSVTCSKRWEPQHLFQSYITLPHWFTSLYAHRPLGQRLMVFLLFEFPATVKFTLMGLTYYTLSSCSSSPWSLLKVILQVSRPNFPTSSNCTVLYRISLHSHLHILRFGDFTGPCVPPGGISGNETGSISARFVSQSGPGYICVGTSFQVFKYIYSLLVLYPGQAI